MMSKKNILYKAILVLLLIIAGTLQADWIKLKNNKKIEGIFLGVNKTKKMNFQIYGEENPRDIPLNKIAQLKLDKDVKIFVQQKNNSRKAGNALLQEMKDDYFLIRFPDSNSSKKVPLFRISQIKVDLDMQFYLRRMQEFRQNEAKRFSEESISAESLLTSGKVTILHFALSNDSLADRQGNFAKRLCSENASAEYQLLLLNSPESLFAQKNSLRSFPQFWFFDSRGNLQNKLIERFTEEDIELAFTKAQNKKP